MFENAEYFWLILGVFLILSEIILPGLVSAFIGLGALSVAAALHYGSIQGITEQLITWFASSTVYIFTLRLLVMRFYPTDRVKQNIDENQAMMGEIVEVVSEIPAHGVGRVLYGESTWNAISRGSEVFEMGSKVKIIGRDNISLVVSRINSHIANEKVASVKTDDDINSNGEQ